MHDYVPNTPLLSSFRHEDSAMVSHVIIFPQVAFASRVVRNGS